MVLLTEQRRRRVALILVAILWTALVVAATLVVESRRGDPPWEITGIDRTAGATDQEIQFSTGAPCRAEHRVRILREEPDSIEVLLEFREPSGDVDDCGSGMTVPIEEPVGHRTVTDLGTGLEIEIRDLEG